ncbi:hypothetical protein F5888DRAFT_1638505 [Russula emetica]|nr:hypothetical protein F5888DRAFT_1638505 [Russula emetica]
MTAALGARQVESCGREEWTGEWKADSIKSQGQETQLGVLGTPRQDRSPTTGDLTSPASAPLVVAVSGLRRDNVRNVLKVGKLARRFCPTQSTGDEIEALPTAVEAVEDALAGGMQFVDPVDVAGALAGAEDEVESGLRPSQEIQEPQGEGIPGSVLAPISGGVVWGEGLEGVGVHLGSGSPHGSLGHGGVGWALPDEARQGPPSQVGDEEVGEAAVVGKEPIRSGGSLGSDGGCGGSGSQEGDIPLQTLDSGLVGLRALEEGVGGDLGNLPEVVGASSSAEGLKDGEGGLGGDMSFWEDGLRKCQRGGW